MDIDSFLSQCSALFSNITVMSPDAGAMLAFILAVVLLGCSGFVSASEIAFFSLSPTDLNTIEEEKHPADSKIISLKSDSERLLATILISNNFVNVAIIMLLNYFFASTVDFGGSDILEFVFMTVLLTFLLLLFGEIMPKIYSAQHTLSFCRMVASAFVVIEKVFWPLSSFLVRSKKLATKVVQKETRPISVDELEQALELTDKKDIAEEKNMLEGIIRFGGETAREIMTPRMDIVDLDMKTSYPGCAEVHSRKQLFAYSCVCGYQG